MAPENRIDFPIFLKVKSIDFFFILTQVHGFCLLFVLFFQSFPKSHFRPTPPYLQAVLRIHFLCSVRFCSRQSLYLELITQTQVFSLEEGGGCCKSLGYPIQGQVESFSKHPLEGGANLALPQLPSR